MSIHTLAPQAFPRVEPEFPLSLWTRVRREILARMETVSGHRDPFETCCWCCRPSGSKGRHVKGGHVKDAAQDGSVKVFILSIAIFQSPSSRRPLGVVAQVVSNRSNLNCS